MTDYNYPLPDLRSQILSFKVAQLQNCAGRLGISKSGKKAEIQSRLLAYFGLNSFSGPGDIGAAVQGKLESAARVIKDVYCQSRGIVRNPSRSPGLGGPSTATTNGASAMMNGAGIASTSNAAYHTSNPLVVRLNSKATAGVIQCLCKNSSSRSGMVQCSEPTCRVWQHADCVGFAATTNTATNFYCEQCRVHLADPFWRPLEQLLPVAKLKPTVGVPPIRDSYNELHPQQTAELTVYLSEQQLSKGKSLPDSERVIASCLLLEDTVPCRLHWPRNVTMRVNRYPYRVYGRSTTSKMGINQRDESANIATLCLAGRNTLDMQAVENGTWLILLHRVEARTVNQVKEMMLPIESVGEAVTRVKKLMHDDDFAIASQVVSLIDPWSGQRMTMPARFTNASGLQAFDLDSFLSLAQRNRKWQDPSTLKNSTVRQLQVDTYTKTVLSCLSGGGGSGPLGEIREIVINDEGKWRPEGTDEASLRWFSIEEDEELVKKELREFYSSGGGGNGEKSPGGKQANGNKGSAHTTPNGGGGDSEGVFLSDTESDEEEELRKAAAAVKASAAQAAEAGKKRKAESEPEPEVICLLSDSDDDNGGPPAQLVRVPGRATAGANPLPRYANTAATAPYGRDVFFARAAPPPPQPPRGFPANGRQQPPPGIRNPGSMRVPVQPNPSNCFNPRGGGVGGDGRVAPVYVPPPSVVASMQPQRSLSTSQNDHQNASRVLSQSAQEALAETLAAIHGDPSLMDQVNQDDW